MRPVATAATGGKRRAVEQAAANTSGTAIHVDEGDEVLGKPEGWDEDAAALAQESLAKLRAMQLADDKLAEKLDHLTFQTTWRIRQRVASKGLPQAADEEGEAAMTYAINVIVGAPCRNGGFAFGASKGPRSLTGLLTRSRLTCDRA